MACGYERLILVIKYRGTHGNLRLWRLCKTQQSLFGGADVLFSLKQEAPTSIGGSTFTEKEIKL